MRVGFDGFLDQGAVPAGLDHLHKRGDDAGIAAASEADYRFAAGIFVRVGEPPDERLA